MIDQLLDDELQAAIAAREAFERSDHYEWCGAAISWSNRHDWLWIAILRKGELVHEQAALAAMWLGQVIEVEDVRALERRWRNQPDAVLDSLADFFARFRNDSPETVAALGIANQIQDDIGASTDEPAESSAGEGEPKKSAARPATSIISTKPPGLTQTKSDTDYHMPKDSSSTRSSSMQPATSF